MIPAHADLVSRLTDTQATALAIRLALSDILPTNLPDTVTGPMLAQICTERRLSHAEVVLACAQESGEFWVTLLSTLLERPMYMCARGETGTPVTDIHGRPIPTPIGHRLGEQPQMPTPPRRTRDRVHLHRKRDHRLIVDIVPNPKQPGSKSWHRFQLYREGMTVSEYKLAGGYPQDIGYDVAKNYIRLRMPT